jgi:lipopolysaccharide cholinephosphotransferase
MIKTALGIKIINLFHKKNIILFFLLIINKFSYTIQINKPLIPKKIISMYTKRTIEKNSETILTLYQMLKDIHDLLTLKNIPYWIDAGTLLGAIRHKGLIPWDDDLDISIDIHNEYALLALQPILHALGYEITPIYFGYKIFPANGIKWPNESFKFPFLDIFITHVVNDKVFYERSFWGNRGDIPQFLTLEELYPLTMYEFGEYRVYGPAKPDLFLYAKYGHNWLTQAHHYNHTNTHQKELVYSYGPFFPAQPTGPIKNRIKN